MLRVWAEPTRGVERRRNINCLQTELLAINNSDESFLHEFKDFRFAFVPLQPVLISSVLLNLQLSSARSWRLMSERWQKRREAQDEYGNSWRELFYFIFITHSGEIYSLQSDRQNVWGVRMIIYQWRQWRLTCYLWPHTDNNYTSHRWNMTQRPNYSFLLQCLRSSESLWHETPPV